MAWVRWTTPDEPEDMTIDVDVSGPGSAQATIHCKIVDLDRIRPIQQQMTERLLHTLPGPGPAGENLGPVDHLGPMVAGVLGMAWR